VVALSALVAPTCALGLNYNVTRQDDPDNTQGACAVGGSCSLREAVNTANAHAGADVITLGAGDFTRNNALGSPTLTEAATVTGAGPRATTVHGSAGSGVLAINSAGTYAIRDLTVTGGNQLSGGGIVNNNGALTLTRVDVVDNKVTAICPLPPGGFPSSGGGIQSGGTTGSLTLVDSLVTNNHADGLIAGACFVSGIGGGIEVDGPLTVIDSTITGNDAGNGGVGAGGGIAEQLGAPAAIVLKNATLAGNRVNGGAGGNLIISNNKPSLSTTGSIIAGGTAAIGTENCSLSGATVMASGGNVEDRDQCGLGPPDRRNADPQLGPLLNNGGPTDTRAIPSSSPAFDFAGACGLAADQRGVARPQGAACDSGAFELVPSAGSGGSGGGGSSSGGASQGTSGSGSGGGGGTGPACTITPSGNAAGLLVRVSCNEAASVTLGGDVTVTAPRRKKRAHHGAAKTVALTASSAQIAPGTASTLKLKVPASVVSAVKRGGKATAHLTLVASAGTAQSQASSTFTIKKAPKKKRRRKR
jgi:CSLREA domain-containing protein